MYRTYCHFSCPALAIAVLAVLVSGCLVVVEKDDDRHDRHRHLYAEWTVDIVVYRTATVSTPASDVTVTFEESGRLIARTDCGETTGSFEVKGDDAITISDLETRSDCASGAGAFELFNHAIAEARSFDVDEHELRISASDDGMIGLSSR